MMVVLYLVNMLLCLVVDDEETLIMEEVSRSKMLAKQNNPILKEKKVNTTLINYVELNKLSKDFGKCFVPQQELSTEQAFRFHMSNLTTESSDASPIKVEAPSKLPKVSFVNECLKKLKFHLAKFDSMVKIRTTLDALTEEIFQKDKSCDDQNDLEISNFKKNYLKAQLQDKDTTICKLKELIKSMRENNKEEKVNHDISELETINAELENSVAKLLSQNEHLCKEINHVKQVFKDQFNPIKKTRVRTKEQSDSLIAKLNLKSVENEDLKAPIQDKVESSKTSNSNTPVLSSTGLKCSTSTCRSKPTGNKKNDRISQPQSSNMKNKVEAQHRRVTLNSNKKIHVVEPIRDADVKHSLLNANSELICATCNQCMFDVNHDMCALDFVKNVNGCSKSAKKHKKQNIWKPMGHVFIEVGFKWKPTGRTFTLVGNSCPLTRFTPTKVVPIKESTPHSVESQKPMLKVYSRRPKHVKNVDVPYSSSFVNDMLSRLFSGTVRFINDQIAKIMGYGDYQLGNVIISRVYYVEGLGHNLFSVGQFCDVDLEVAFRKNTCFIRNLEGVDLLSGSRDTNLYIIYLDDMLKTSLICLLTKASKTKSWLWHCRLSHLNFGTLNKLAKDGLARGIPKLKFQKDHLCSACALGKSKKSSYQPNAEDTNQEKLYLFHMDLCGPMRVESINGKKYILVHLSATVRNVRTDNGTKFVNQTLRDFYENVSILNQTSFARTPQQNGVVER
ncbi:retrovirus-related pol polyprotein from transposon TNT 1-94 [Tanacetum coccineum]